MIRIYTDGAALGNPGPGGFGTILEFNGNRKELSQGFRLTTNNRMELLAVIEGLRALKMTGIPVTIYSDSKNTVSQLNHEFAINSEPLRELARKAWSIMGKIPNLKIVWIPRAQNLAGKMLGS